MNFWYPNSQSQGETHCEILQDFVLSIMLRKISIEHKETEKAKVVLINVVFYLNVDVFQNVNNMCLSYKNVTNLHLSLIGTLILWQFKLGSVIHCCWLLLMLLFPSVMIMIQILEKRSTLPLLQTNFPCFPLINPVYSISNYVDHIC